MKKLLLFLFITSYISIAQAQGVKYLLLEEFSTAPCGFCPEGDLIAQQLIDTYPQVIWVTHHAGFGTDAMTIPESSVIAGAFTTFAPGACIDRGDYPIPVYTIAPYIAVSRQKWDSIVVAHLNDPVEADVIISNSYNYVTRKLNCTVDVNFITTPAAGDLRLNIFLVEDSVTGIGSGYDQTNYFNTTVGHAFYNLGDPIVGYTHHHVIRKALTGNWGLAGTMPQAPLAGSSYSQTFNNIDILPDWKDQDVTIVAFVSYYNTDAHLRQVINSNEVPMNFTTTIQDVQSNEIMVYPNPAADYVYIKSNNQNLAGYYFELYDIGGRLVKQSLLNDNSSKVLLDDLKNGVYFYKLFSGDKSLAVEKLTIIR